MFRRAAPVMLGPSARALIVGSVLWAGSAHAGPLAAEPSSPDEVVGGEEAGLCAFPSVVALLNGASVNCTGTLVHPQVVLTAAHCVDPQFSGSQPSAIAFGEDGNAPSGTMPITRCEWHTDWSIDPFAKDLGYCVLAAPVEDIATIPVLMGCESDALQVDETLTIVGYGATRSTLISGSMSQIEGVGPKRFLDMQIDEVTDGDEILMSVPSGGGCNGDSGGPALIQVEDGSWRVVGAASRRDVGANWMPQAGEELCPEGLGLFYGRFDAEMWWFEQQTGFDLTPCHDAMGNWDPGPSCTEFPLDPGTGVGSWNDACQPALLGGQPGYCEESLPPQTGTDSGDSGSGLESGTSGTTGHATDSMATTAGDTDMTSSSFEGDEAAGGAKGGGCGCASGPEDRSPMRSSLVVIMMVLVSARRVKRNAHN